MKLREFKTPKSPDRKTQEKGKLQSKPTSFSDKKLLYLSKSHDEEYYNKFVSLIYSALPAIDESKSLVESNVNAATLSHDEVKANVMSKKPLSNIYNSHDPKTEAILKELTKTMVKQLNMSNPMSEMAKMMYS